MDYYLLIFKKENHPEIVLFESFENFCRSLPLYVISLQNYLLYPDSGIPMEVLSLKVLIV